MGDIPPQQTALYSLPIECRQAILGLLPDTQSLRAAVEAHPAFQAAFVDRKEWVLGQVLRQCIPPELLPDSILEYRSSVLENEAWTREKVLAILEECRPHGIPSSFKWTPKGAVHMEHFYSHVRFFASNFICIARETYPALSERAVSPKEWCRVARSFYRVEIYRQMFRRRDIGNQKTSPDFDFYEQNEVYYDSFAAFELEQLACVSEYLFRKVTIPFSEIAAHDIKWAFKGVGYSMTEPWESFHSATRISNVISHGLEFLHEMLAAETYEERYQLLTPTITAVNTFLPNALWYIFPRDEEDTQLLRDYDQKELGLYATPEAPESDSGPVEIWRLAHLDKSVCDFVYSMDMREKRRWGYVMWDYARLAELGIFDTAISRAPTPDHGENEMLEAVTGSLVKRWKLWWKGARGWWEEEDESQLRWEGPELQLSDEEFEEDSFRSRILM